MPELFRHIPKLPLLAGLLCGLLVLGGSWSIGQNEATIRHNCGQIETIKKLIRHTIGENRSTLGRPGSAGYAYYHDHPAELAKAIRLSSAELAIFHASRCH